MIACEEGISLRHNTKTVLLVDDDRSILRTFTRILKKAGYETEAAESGREALEKIQARSFDVALVDIVLGDSNGLDLLSRIREKSPKTVRMAITGSDSRQTRDEAYVYGADVFLTKPVNPVVLLSIFEERLKSV